MRGLVVALRRGAQEQAREQEGLLLFRLCYWCSNAHWALRVSLQEPVDAKTRAEIDTVLSKVGAAQAEE